MSSDHDICFCMLKDFQTTAIHELDIVEFIYNSSIELKTQCRGVLSKLFVVKGFISDLCDALGEIQKDYKVNIPISQRISPLIPKHKEAFTKFYNLHDCFENFFIRMKNDPEMNDKLERTFRIKKSTELYNKVNEFLFAQFHMSMSGILKKTNDEDKDQLVKVVSDIDNNIKAIDQFGLVHSNVEKNITIMNVIDNLHVNHCSQILTIIDVEKTNVNSPEVNTFWVFHDKIYISTFINDVYPQKLTNLQNVKNRYRKTAYDLTKLNLNFDEIKTPFKYAQVFCGLNNLNFGDSKVAFVSEIIEPEQLKKIKIKRYTGKNYSMMNQLCLNITYAKGVDEVTLKLVLVPRNVRSIKEFEAIKTDAFNDNSTKWIKIESEHNTSESSSVTSSSKVIVDPIYQLILESHEELAVFLSDLFNVKYEKKIIEIEADDDSFSDQNLLPMSNDMRRSYVNDSFSSISSLMKTKQLTRKVTKSISQIMHFKSNSSHRSNASTQFRDLDQDSITGMSLFEASVDESPNEFSKISDFNSRRTISDCTSSLNTSNDTNKSKYIPDTIAINDSLFSSGQEKVLATSMSNVSQESVDSVTIVDTPSTSKKSMPPPSSIIKPKVKKLPRPSWFLRSSGKENTPKNSQKNTFVEPPQESPIETSKFRSKRTRNGKAIIHSTPKTRSAKSMASMVLSPPTSPVGQCENPQSDDTASVSSLAPSNKKKSNISTVFKSVRKSFSRDKK